MIKSIEFHNFKALRDTTLPLERFTLLLGPNGSGKSSALQAIQFAQDSNWPSYEDLISVGNVDSLIKIVFTFDSTHPHTLRFELTDKGKRSVKQFDIQEKWINHPQGNTKIQPIEGFGSFNFDPSRIAAPASLATRLEITSNGEGLAVVLD
ncbi:MAG TPA: AAA family ATPase, partial [Acidobacteriota bacterium]|nr:AAA family ATPase [Acidobacteriota bacterium]